MGNLPAELPLRAAPGSPLALPEGGTATHGVDGLTVVDAEVLAEYEHPHFGRWPAITTRRHGAGHVTCVGTVPGRGTARALAEWLSSAPSSGWGTLPASVTVTTGNCPDGRRAHVVHDWSWQEAAVRAPGDLTDVLDGSVIPVGTSVGLGAWDVRVFVTS
ncbi:hypothetical protein [Streptomyces sp. IMTB 2501]|uniref:hypothetical protein n=1 Tax=Streptomyces sp. IMTB 2501 TaxID=1776340 RepID=UPI0015B9730A|nr:hypothetical protein [Streptomyces sp. IMTB 2501]